MVGRPQPLNPSLHSRCPPLLTAGWGWLGQSFWTRGSQLGPAEPLASKYEALHGCEVAPSIHRSGPIGLGASGVGPDLTGCGDRRGAAFQFLCVTQRYRAAQPQRAGARGEQGRPPGRPARGGAPRRPTRSGLVDVLLSHFPFCISQSSRRFDRRGAGGRHAPRHPTRAAVPRRLQRSELALHASRHSSRQRVAYLRLGHLAQPIGLGGQVM